MDRLGAAVIGTHDVPCPICGPQRRSSENRRRKVLRVWRMEKSFATYHCARCGEHGYVRDNSTSRQPIDREAIARAKAESEERESVAAAKQLQKAKWLWGKRQSLKGTIGERYLREARN